VDNPELIDMAEMDLDRLIAGMHNSGLSYHDIIRIMSLRLEMLLVQFEAECQIY